MIILLIAAFIFIASLCYAVDKSRVDAFIRGTVITAAVGVLIAELTSLFTAYNLLWVSLCWAAVLAAACWLHMKRLKTLLPFKGVLTGLPRLSRWQKLLMAMMVGTVACALFHICLSPPNSPVDGLVYHQTRAFMYYKTQSIHNFASPYGHLLYFGPLNAIWMSQFQILCFGWDGLYQGVQFIAYLLSMLAVYRITRLICKGRAFALIAAALVCFMPMAYLQAFTTQSDLLITALCVTAIYYMATIVCTYKKTKAVCPACCVLLGLSCGLAVLSKLNAGVVLIGFSLSLAAYLLIKLRGKAVSRLLIIVLCVVLMTGGFWTRNAMDWNGDFLPLSYAGTRPDYESLGVKGVLLIAAKAIAVNFATPSGQMVGLLSKPSLAMAGLAAKLLGMDMNDPITSEGGVLFTGLTGYSPDCVSYPFQSFIVLVAFIFCLIYACRKRNWLLLSYTICCVLSVAITCTQYQWCNSFNRYLMPSYVAAMPLSAYMLERLTLKRRGGWRKVILAFMSLTFAFNGICVFTCLRGELTYYNSAKPAYDERVVRLCDPSVLTLWRQVTEDVQVKGYTQLGLHNDVMQGDYIWLRPFAAPEYDVRFINTSYRTDLEDAAYNPDCIIATCHAGEAPDSMSYHGRTYVKTNECPNVYRGLYDCQFVYYVGE